MSSLLQSPFMEDSINEVVPDVAKVAGKLSASSVITARRRVRLVPQSGQNYTIGAGGSANTVNILIQDGQAYADLLSAVLSFEVEVSGTGGAVCLDDGAYSVFRRALISVNSTLMDDIDFLPKKVNSEMYATVSQDWYNSVGSMMGCWKQSTTVYGSNNAVVATAVTNFPNSVGINGFYDKYNVGAKQAVASAVQTAGSGKNKFFIPICLLSHFFRNEMLFPLRNAGQLYVQLNLASLAEAVVCATGATATAVNVKNLTMEMDFVDLHPTYLAMMDEIMERPDEDGVRWPFDAHLVSAQNYAGAGQQSVIVSKASQNLRSIHTVFQPRAGLSDAQYPKQSTFANPSFVDIQTRIGSLYYPAFPSLLEHRAFCDLQNSFGSPASLDKTGIADLQNYYNLTQADGTMAVAPYAGGASGAGAPYQAFSDCFIWGYCFDKLKHATLRGIDLDGVNTLTSSGSQIVVQVNQNGLLGTNAEAVLTAIVRFTRVLEIKGGATRVIG